MVHKSLRECFGLLTVAQGTRPSKISGPLRYPIKPFLEVLLSMTLQWSGTACASVINNCFVSGGLGSNQQDYIDTFV
jgi:hypothetical protein